MANLSFDIIPGLQTDVSAESDCLTGRREDEETGERFGRLK